MRGQRQAARAAIDRHALVVAVGHVAAKAWGSGQVDVDVIGDKQIQAAVAVVIDESAAGAEAGAVSSLAGRPCAVTSVKVPSPLFR